MTEAAQKINGIRVFGSALIRVAPDTASIVTAVARLEQKPDSAFSSAQKGAKAVTAYLKSAGVSEFGSSRVTLQEERRFVNGESKFLGYVARIEYHILLQDMDKVEAVLCGVIAAGANELQSVAFETTRLKQLRADTRRRAVKAAREKAQLYCEAAGVALGDVRSIEDANPELLSGRSEGHAYREPPTLDDVAQQGPIDPKAIAVSAGVYIMYEIKGVG